MTKAFENMLYLLGAGARGYEADASGMDMAEVRQCAIAQGVWPIVYKAAEKTADVSAWRHEFFFTMAKSVAKRDFSLSMIKKIEEAGVEYCLMKGPSAAALYANPDCRISSDIDIYINPRHEMKVISILKANDYIIKPRAKGEHHFQATHPIGGLFEVHIRVYSKTSEKIVFGGHISYSNDFDKIVIDGKEYNVMNSNDELMYLTAHYIKHLVNGGCGIRQILDMLLYMEKHSHKIDFDKYVAVMKKLRYHKLLDVIKTIGTKYFGYDYPLLHEELAEKLLTDTEKGGTFGFLADDRDNFYNMYCSKRTHYSRLRHIIYMGLNSDRDIFFRLFPPKTHLINQGYEYAKHSVLIPFAWIHKLINAVLRRKNNHSKSPELASKRLDMMKELEMID